MKISVQCHLIEFAVAQNELARAEASFIANTDNQYIVPTSGKPIRGLIQDHVCGGVLLTMKDTFLTRDEYHHLVYGCLYHVVNSSRKAVRIATEPPVILKPKPMWTGKQVISTVLKTLTRDRPPFNLESGTKVFCPFVFFFEAFALLPMLVCFSPSDTRKCLEGGEGRRHCYHSPK